MIDRFTRLLSGSLLVVSLALAPALHAQDAPAATEQQSEEKAESKPAVVVPNNQSPYEFAPEESAVHVDATNIDLRQVFEDLGPDATLWYQHVQTLANPYFEGRAPGLAGNMRAAEYIEFWFRQYGLEPAFPEGDEELGGGEAKAFIEYRQPFDFQSPNPDVKVLEAGNAINGKQLVEGKDFVVLGNSGNGKVTAPVTFVGYGIEEGKDGYTSFDEAASLEGRIALVMRYEPLDEQGKSRWSPSRFSRHSAIATKMRTLAERGAAGIVLVNPPVRFLWRK